MALLNEYPIDYKTLYSLKLLNSLKKQMAKDKYSEYDYLIAIIRNKQTPKNLR